MASGCESHRPASPDGLTAALAPHSLTSSGSNCLGAQRPYFLTSPICSNRNAYRGNIPNMLDKKSKNSAQRTYSQGGRWKRSDNPVRVDTGGSHKGHWKACRAAVSVPPECPRASVSSHVHGTKQVSYPTCHWLGTESRVK